MEIINNDLFVKSDLIRKQVVVSASCVIRGEYEKIVSHLFFTCPIPSTIWFTSVCGFRVDFFFFLVCLFVVVVSWDKLKWIFCNPNQ